MRRLFFYSNLIIISIWVILFFIFQFVSYPDFIQFIFGLLKIDDSRRDVYLAILNAKLFNQVKWFFLALAFIQAIILFILIKKPQLLDKLKLGINSIIQYPNWLLIKFKNLKGFEKISFVFFLILLIIQRLYLSHSTGVIYDEAWTYLAFTSKNPIVAACFYPTSNNHILFSHFTQFTKLLPFNILTNLRLAALIPNILAIVTLFFCIRNYVKPLTAWIGILLFAFSFPVVYYGFVARGYSFLVLFFIVGFFSLLDIIQNFENQKAWYRLSISSVLGFYTIPIYLYPFISLFGFGLCFFLFNKNSKALGQLIKHGFGVFVLTIITYAPIFAVSGIESVTNNKFVKPLHFQQIFAGIFNHLSQTFHFLTALSFGYILIAFVVFFALFISKNLLFKRGNYLSIFLFLCVPVLIIAHKVLPVERTWIYLLIPFIFLLCQLLDTIKWPKMVLAIGIIYLGCINFNWTRNMLWYDEICEEEYLEGSYFSDFFHTKKAVIVTSSNLNSYLKFNKLLRNEDWIIETDSSNSADTNIYFIKNQLSHDSMDFPIGLQPIKVYKKYILYK